MMCACGHIGANIASLRNEVEQHHFERSEKHHIAVRRCIIYKNTKACALVYWKNRDVDDGFIL